jgi:4-carboxymuconolactone decarboxylase
MPNASKEAKVADGLPVDRIQHVLWRRRNDQAGSVGLAYSPHSPKSVSLRNTCHAHTSKVKFATLEAGVCFRSARRFILDNPNNKDIPMPGFLSVSPALLLTLFTANILAQSLPADLNPDSMARLPYVKRADLDADGQTIYDMLPGRRDSGDVSGPLAWPAYNPGVAKALLDLHNAAVGSENLGAYERELAIMVACRETNYMLEWDAHKRLALSSGIPESVLDVVRDNRSVHDLNDKDAVIIHLGRTLYREKMVDSETFARAKDLFGAKGLMDMVAVMNTYAVSGFFAATVDEHVAGSELWHD